MKKVMLVCFALYGFFLVIWWMCVGNPFFYFSNQALPGQSFYLLTKFFGFLSVCALLVQVAIGVASATRLLSESKIYHSTNALLLVGFAVLHVLSFFCGVSIRSNKPAWEIFVPRFTDYYHFMLGLGVAAFLLSLTMFTIGALLRRRLQRCYAVRLLHYTSPLIIVVAAIHSFSIGSETRAVWFIAVFSCLVGMILTILAIGSLSKAKAMQFSP